MLEQSDIAHYLLSLGLVKPRHVVEQDLTIVDASRRNRVFIASTRAGPAHVVKQAGPLTAHTLAHEAAVLGSLARAPTLVAHVPAVVHEERAESLLVLRTPGGARDWGELHGAGRFSLTQARSLGRVLAALHALPADAVEELPERVDTLWGLSLPEPSHELVLDLSAGAQDLVARLQAGAELCERLAALGEAVAGEALTHGDLRWDNCLALAAPGARRRTRLLLVDWELAGGGPPGFDAGTVLAEYLSAWVGSIPIVAPAEPERLLARARLPLRRMLPAIRAFWSEYARATPGASLRRTIELGAVRLLQTAVESAQRQAAASAHVVTLLQLADNMLRRPDEAAQGLLGLRA